MSDLHLFPLSPPPVGARGRLETLSTDGIEPRFRLDYWIGAISEALFSLSATSPDSLNFSSRMTIASLDSLQIIQTSGSARDSYRTIESLAKATDYSFHLVGDYRYAMNVLWRGRPIRLEPGDLFFADTRYLHSGHHAKGVSIVYFKIPASWAHTWLRFPDRLAGTKIPRGSGWGQALSTFVVHLTPQLAVNSPLPPKLLADNLGALLSLVEEELLNLAPLPEAKDRQQRELVKDEIRQRATEPGLTASDVASGLKISESTLHRRLAFEGKTFAGYLLQFRIELAKRMLEAKNFNTVTTAEIGRRAGFADASYFSRTVKRELGLSPDRYRNSVRKLP